MGKPKDLFPVLDFLLDENNQYTNGKNISVDGGFEMVVNEEIDRLKKWEEKIYSQLENINKIRKNKNYLLQYKWCKFFK